MPTGAYICYQCLQYTVNSTLNHSLCQVIRASCSVVVHSPKPNFICLLLEFNGWTPGNIQGLIVQLYSKFLLFGETFKLQSRCMIILYTIDNLPYNVFSTADNVRIFCSNFFHLMPRPLQSCTNIYAVFRVREHVMECQILMCDGVIFKIQLSGHEHTESFSSCLS